jgi:thiamine-phosphate pyrophosphorylase
VDPLARIVDANANRALEALRTLEDVARFAIADATLAGGLKECRHSLRQALGRLPVAWLPANRSTAADIGTGLGTEGEYQRAGLDDIAGAATSRTGEALRTIEECLKAVDPQLAREVESVRYRAYDLSALVLLRAPGARRQWSVCVLVTERLCVRPWQEVVRGALDGGADAIQLREKDLDGSELVERAAWIAELARRSGAQTIVNDRVDVAIAAGADGVHVGQTDLTPRQVRQICGRRLIVGMSTHDVAEAERAMVEGADYCGVGAMFPTNVKPDATRGGPAWLAMYLSRFAHVPHLAIGGITPDNISVLSAAGCRGVAVSQCVCAAQQPDVVVRRLREALR